MAKQSGVVKIEGTIDDLTFYKFNGKYKIRKKGGIPKSRIQNDPRFKRVRENNAEFGRVSKGISLMRKALSAMLHGSKKVQTGDLMPVFFDVLRSDATHPRGERTLSAGNLLILEQLNLNSSVTLDQIFNVSSTVTVDRANGEAIIQFPSWEPHQLEVPQGATHYQINTCAALINFSDDHYEQTTQAGVIAALPQAQVAGQSVTLNFTAGSVLPILVAVGIRFYVEVNGVQMELYHAEFNPVEVVEVDV